MQVIEVLIRGQDDRVLYRGDSRDPQVVLAHSAPDLPARVIETRVRRYHGLR